MFAANTQFTQSNNNRSWTSATNTVASPNHPQLTPGIFSLGLEGKLKAKISLSSMMHLS